ncbi:ATP-dependent protease ATPase subunit HslU [Dirofilaria immitis]
MEEENCGPAGSCFILRKDSKIKGSNFTVRGCDHTFLCELISEATNIKKVIHNNEIIRYCMDNVHYIKFSGYFCCCNNHDWCNKHSKAEEISEERILEDLMQGTATNEKWQKLQKMAEEEEINIAK